MNFFKKIKDAKSHWKNYKDSLKKENYWFHFIVDWIETIVVALVLALLIRHFIIMTSIVPTGSMIPTFKINDRLFVNKFIYRFTTPERGDIVVFKSPKKDKNDYVKRCIGLPGDTIEIKKGIVYINQLPLSLPGVNIQRDYDYKSEITVPDNQYYVLGDNRANSLDSRYWGFVPKENLVGKALFTFWPLNRMRILR
tara:strand:- start:842 stop:1429 length:588 start_codon:yes stop_codon:yes gene_type:complete